MGAWAESVESGVLKDEGVVCKGWGRSESERRKGSPLYGENDTVNKMFEYYFLKLSRCGSD